MRMSYNWLALLLFSGAAAMAASTQGLTRLSGTLVSSASSSIVIKTATGNRTVALTPTTRFFALDKSSLANVGKGSFIGTTVVPQPNGSYKSTEVHISAPSLRGTGEGFTKMNAGGNHMMANSTVQTVETPKMMANSTVRTVGSNGAGKTITMTFPSGTKTIVIPANVPVYWITRGSRAMLNKGAPVSTRVTTGPQGLVAGFLLVGLHGTVPPM